MHAKAFVSVSICCSIVIVIVRRLSVLFENCIPYAISRPRELRQFEGISQMLALVHARTANTLITIINANILRNNFH